MSKSREFWCVPGTVALVLALAFPGASGIASGEPGPVELYGYEEDGVVTLVWDPPRWEGLSAVTEYHVYRLEVTGSLDWIGATTGTSYTDVLPGDDEAYAYFVTAENDQGEGPKSNPVLIYREVPSVLGCAPLRISLNPPGIGIEFDCIRPPIDPIE